MISFAVFLVKAIGSAALIGLGYLIALIALELVKPTGPSIHRCDA